MRTDPRADSAEFQFLLTPRQAQTLFDVVECMKEERRLFSEIYRTTKDRARVRTASTRFARQLNNQYRATGIEV